MTNTLALVLVGGEVSVWGNANGRASTAAAARAAASSAPYFRGWYTIDPGSVGVPDARDLQLDKVGMMTDEHDVLRAVGVRSYGRRNKLSSIITSAAKALGRNTPRS